ncbi:MAG: uracil-DNA glycosylase family protein [Bacteroidetes bacterium]|nr:uracil-DNA glycosylase family protein [Bacteroidota bacterium]
MENLLKDIRNCTRCAAHLPHGCRPIMSASSESRLVIIGQAPGRRVHESGIPWDDASGDNLRTWLGIDKSVFYDASKIALVPMGFCYPGTGKSGDLPPRPECAPQWHGQVLSKMPKVQLTLLIGQYAQNHYLGTSAMANLTETVRNFEAYLPKYFPLPHPSPRNNIWQKKNAWFMEELLPELRRSVVNLLQ